MAVRRVTGLFCPFPGTNIMAWEMTHLDTSQAHGEPWSVSQLPNLTEPIPMYALNVN